MDAELSDNREVAGAIGELLEAFSRDIESRGFTAGFNPAQWAALRFFRRANASARTVTAFARAHRTTTGTATRTIAALVRKGCLARSRARDDRRVARIDLTAAGEQALRADPLRQLIAAIGGLPRGQRSALLEGLWTLRQAISPAGRDRGGDHAPF